uniref:HydroxymethylglutarylCoA lyase putative n=1 Tax=Albugo laibachii Nc14 TaxID=890382 RepID=F0W246_9STRA|nr:hydroxymethylglutarylCoA lyase putative [Albugo laibachii Nc14]|eukprot:CCA15126.1 hydroxymethylglutarylCoA lyase putative [Albugo laibachii Nc14]
MGLFSSKPKSSAHVRRNTAKISEKDLAILELKNTRDKLKKYQKCLDIETQQLHESARKLVLAKRPERAKIVLQIKKFKERQISQADVHLLNVIKLIDTVSWETEQLKVFEAIKGGNKLLHALHEEMNVEAVEKLMLETRDAQQTHEEISCLLAGYSSEGNEDAILQELHEMEALALEESLPHVPTEQVEEDAIVPSCPKVQRTPDPIATS